MARSPRRSDAASLPTGVRAKPRVDREARKADYLRAAARAFLAKGAGASMQDVANAAGAPKPVFYRIFPSRAELIDALYQHVHDVIVETHKGEWDGYGWALRVLYIEAKKEPEIFLVTLRTFRGDPGLEHWRERLLGLMYRQATGFFQPAEGMGPVSPDKILQASRSMSSFFFETLVVWLEDRDGLSEEARFKWCGRIIREWRKATREAYELDPPEQVEKNDRKSGD